MTLKVPEALLSAEARYRRLVNRMSAVIFELEPDGTLHYVNDAVEKITGYSPSSLEGQNWYHVFFPGEMLSQMDALIPLLQAGDVSDYELTLLTAHGDQVTIALNTANDYDPSGQLVRIFGFGLNVTERKLAEEKVARSERELAQAQQIAHLGSWVWDIRANTVTWSDELYRIYGFRPQEIELTYEVFLEFVHPEDRLKVREQITKAYQEASSFVFEHRIVRRDETIRWLMARGEILTSSVGEPVMMIGTGQDITDRVETEQTLRDQAASLQLLHDITVSANEASSIEEAILFALTKVCKFAGWPFGHAYLTSPDQPNHLLSTKLWHFDPDNDFKTFRAATEALEVVPGVGLPGTVLASGNPVVIPDVYNTDYFVRKDSAVVDGITSAFAFPVLQGKEVVGVLEFFTTSLSNQSQNFIDLMFLIGTQLGRVVERKRSQAELAYQSYLLDNVNDAIIATDENFIVQAWNKAAEAVYRWTAKEAIGRHAAELFVIDWTPEEQQRVLRDLTEIGFYQGEFLQVTRDGRQLYFESRSTALLDEAGTRKGYLAVNRDITDRKSALEALRQSEARFRTIFQESALGIKLMDLEGRLLEVNSAFQEMSGYTTNELLEMRYMDFTHSADLAGNRILFNELVAGRRDVYHLEKRLIHKAGQLLWVRSTVSLVRDENRHPQMVVGLVENITDQKNMQAELEEVKNKLIDSVEAERLHLAQELHDGPVQELYGMNYQIQELILEETIDEKIERLKALQTLLRSINSTLRATAHELRPPTLAPFGLERAILSHADEFGKKHPEMKLHLTLTPDEKTLPERVRLALFRIYQQAMINVTRHAQANNVFVSFELNDEEIRLEIRDDGRGFQVPRRWVDLARQDHLGLIGSSERAEAIGGKLYLESRPGEGTVLRVIAPRQIAT